MWFRYVIHDLRGQRQYLLDVTLNVCLDDSLPCNIRNNILKNYLVTKPVCAWYTGFKNPSIYFFTHIEYSKTIVTKKNVLYFTLRKCEERNWGGGLEKRKITDVYFFIIDFSYISWLRASNISASQSLDIKHMPSLLEALGISKYMKIPACDKEKGVYINSFNGWNSGK